MSKHKKSFAVLLLILGLTRSSGILAGGILDSDSDIWAAGIQNLDTETPKPRKRKKTIKPQPQEHTLSVDSYEAYRQSQISGRPIVGSRGSAAEAAAEDNIPADSFEASRRRTITQLSNPDRAPGSLFTIDEPIMSLKVQEPVPTPIQPMAISIAPTPTPVPIPDGSKGARGGSVPPLPVVVATPTPIPVPIPIPIPTPNPLAMRPAPIPRASVEYHDVHSQREFEQKFTMLDQSKLVLVKFGSVSCAACKTTAASLRANPDPTLKNKIAVFDIEVNEVSRNSQIRQDAQFLHTMFRTIYRREVQLYPSMILTKFENGQLVPIMNGNSPVIYPSGDHDSIEPYIARMLQRAAIEPLPGGQSPNASAMR